MSTVEALMQGVRRQAREKRAGVFRDAFDIGPGTRILDIGSEDGSAIAAVLAGTAVQPTNVYIADIDTELTQSGHRRFGFVPVDIPESGELPFEDKFFDIVYCSSVIEHVTVPKEMVWSIRSDEDFRNRAQLSQRMFASEIRRLGKKYFVQTPNKWFPIESHTWLPFVGYLPRAWQLQVIDFSNRYWVKRTSPDWYLLTDNDMHALFPDATIRRERYLGVTKSIMALKQ
jgi:SAM-dependent methyltransferase